MTTATATTQKSRQLIPSKSEDEADFLQSCIEAETRLVIKWFRGARSRQVLLGMDKKPSQEEVRAAWEERDRLMEAHDAGKEPPETDWREDNWYSWISCSAAYAEQRLIELIRISIGQERHFSIRSDDTDWKSCSITVDGVTYVACPPTGLGIGNNEAHIVVLEPEQMV